MITCETSEDEKYCGETKMNGDSFFILAKNGGTFIDFSRLGAATIRETSIRYVWLANVREISY